ncbi:Similar to Probable transporter AQR1; acc. no. P53943 [Pyronema omphalodes CBS 100304]|uniref:Similar to Probable transporter AQR1 acc. no. P53943 n=1 Tax=Pyronema omphalodes (strain CBS 100304) TaxID=1076935 RepID=U4LSH3_PYROM|nr:Similar to Probable transporter AQR1; acc. no. P53943 [Pyronema omphalodes CBS 100304]
MDPQAQASPPRNSLESSSDHEELSKLEQLSRRFTSVEVLTRNAPAGKISVPRHVHLRQGTRGHTFLELSPLFSGSLWGRGGTPRDGFFPSDNEITTDSESGFCDPPAPYHSFSKGKKLGLAYLVSLAAVFSPLSSNIYFPALNNISAELNTAPDLIALSITIYMVFQGLAPSFWGPLADKYGRRPIFISTLIVYLGANVGLALSKNYATLMVFRGIQAVGSSATIAVGAGTIGDIAMAGERGGLLGIFSGIRMFGQAFGPVIGGCLTQYWGFRSIFYFLLIFASLVVVIIAFFLPETLQRIAGDGTIPLTGVHKPLIENFRKKKDVEEGKPRDVEKPRAAAPVSFKTFLESFKLLFEKDVFITLLFGSIIYAVWSMVTSSTSNLFKKEYHLSDIEIGLVFLPNGLGCVIGSFVTGRLLDLSYRSAANKFRNAQSPPIDVDVELTQQKYPDFPLEHARLVHTWWLAFVFCACTAAYGWTVEYAIAIPLILQFLIAFSATSIFNINSTLMIDLYPSKPASATAINNLMRCTVGAIGVSVVEKMAAAIRDGTTFTVLSGVAAASVSLVWLQWVWGPMWRKERMDRLARKEALALAEADESEGENLKEKA